MQIVRQWLPDRAGVPGRLAGLSGMSVIRDSTETRDSALNVSREMVFGTARHVVREKLIRQACRTVTKQRRTDGRANLVGVLKVSGLVSVFAAVLAGLYFAERYVSATRPAGAGPVVLVDVPAWVSAELKSKVIRTAGRNLKLDEDAARAVAENLASVAWLDAVRVGLTHQEVRIEARWRKPLALIKPGRTSFYIDADRIVLDFVPMPSLPIVTVVGVSVAGMPQPGQVFEQDDLAAAMSLLALLDRMDKKMAPQKPLLGDIAGIDVSNITKQRILPASM